MSDDFFLRVNYDVGDTQSRHQNNQHGQMGDKPIEKMIVALSDARAQPDAMVVEFEHAVVAHGAMAAARGSENAARLAELEVVDEGRLDFHHLVVGNLLAFFWVDY